MKNNFRKSEDNQIIDSLTNWEQRKFKKVAFIAGGTGITPIFQVVLLIKRFLQR
jgi:hypothetical protein